MSKNALQASLAKLTAGVSVSREPVTDPVNVASLGELATQAVLGAFGPPSVLVDDTSTCVFTLGRVNTYLTVPPGYPTQNLFAMTDPTLHSKLRIAIDLVTPERPRVSLPAGRTRREGLAYDLTLVAQAIHAEGRVFTLIAFVDTLATADPTDDVQVEIREMQIIQDDLQRRNSELLALNKKLQVSLDQHQTTSNNLQNVLFSTEVATLFLDRDLTIRYFTPSTRSLFDIVASDIGRPLADLNALSVDDTFLADAISVLKTQVPSENEVHARAGAWYIRRILPYRTQTDDVEGIVVTFTDVSDRRQIADALETAKRRAQQADAAKSRFLAAASHDLRQPLQTLSLLQGLLAQAVEGEKATRLVARIDDTLISMTAMLNTLLDINQIEAGTVSADIVRFPIDPLLRRLGDEFAIAADAQGLTFRVVSSSLDIVSDPRLIEQMIRNILSNALKYTKSGKILLGCRRRGTHIRVEIWDSGLGIPANELDSIFEEYHQIGNAARERTNGLGLGLAIVKRLGDMLGHKVSVCSRLERGSAFAIETESPQGYLGAAPPAIRPLDQPPPVVTSERSGSILVVEDGPDIRLLLEALLTSDGYRVSTAADGLEAIDMITRNLVRPDLILADFNLPNGMNGLQIAAKARHLLHWALPVIILSGDISAETLANIAHERCAQLAKPVKLNELRLAVQRQLATGHLRPSAPHPAKEAEQTTLPVIYIVDDDDDLRLALRDVLQADGRVVEDFASSEAFSAAFRPGREACLLIDAMLPGMSGLELLKRLSAAGQLPPAVMITGNGDIGVAVEAMKCGATDFIEKPLSAETLIAAAERALDLARHGRQRDQGREAAVAQLAGLTPRQHQIMDMILAGHPNKNIAADLGISQRTVENHRAAIMQRTGSTSLPDLARIALAAGN